jgi:hypothetical protein
VKQRQLTSRNAWEKLFGRDQQTFDSNQKIEGDNWPTCFVNPMTNLPNGTAIQAFADEQRDVLRWMREIESTVFQRIGRGQDPAGLVRHLLQSQRRIAHRSDFIAELANAIAAFAANTRNIKELEALVAFTQQLNTQAAALNLDGSPWDNFIHDVIVAGLQRHPIQTNLFILHLLGRKPEGTLVEPIYRYLKHQGCEEPHHFAVFLYFAPELRGYKKSWFEIEWRQVMSRSGSRKSAIQYIAPRLPTDLGSFDIGKHAEKRWRGESSSPLLNAIRRDDWDAVNADCRGDFRKEIPFSLYEQFLHYDYKFTHTDTTLTVELPEVIDAVGLFGARRTFEGITATAGADLPEILAHGAHSLVSGNAIAGGQIAYLQSQGVDLSETLRDAIRTHQNNLIPLLMNQYGAVIDEAAVRETLISANFDAFVRFVHPGLQSVNFAKASLAHYIAEANAIQAFKFSLMKDVEAGREFDPYVVAPAGENRTFLHWGANYNADEVIEFWGRNWGNLGFDAIDGKNWNPCHVAYMRAISGPRLWKHGPAGNEDSNPPDPATHFEPYPGSNYIGKRKQLYAFMEKRTDVTFA